MPPGRRGSASSEAMIRRSVYARGRGSNHTVGVALGTGPRTCLPLRRSISFKLNNVWRGVAVEREQSMCNLQSAFDQLTSDSAERQSIAVQVRDLCYAPHALTS